MRIISDSFFQELDDKTICKVFFENGGILLEDKQSYDKKIEMLSRRSHESHSLDGFSVETIYTRLIITKMSIVELFLFRQYQKLMYHFLRKF